MIQYKLQKNSLTSKDCSVQIVGQPMTSIPFDPANTDYQDYLAWLDEGNEPEAAD
jgi:hypothetical protein